MSVHPGGPAEDFPDQAWWQQQIVGHRTGFGDPVAIATPRKRMASNFHPALVIGEDSRRYVVKGLQSGRSLGKRLFADQVVGRLGMAMDAPVAEVALLWLSEEIAESSFATMHLTPGILHGSVFQEDFEPGWDVEHLDVPENVQRFAQLALLYGWAFADDHQYLYRRTRPHLILSVDHDYFIFGAPDWNAETMAAAPSAIPDPAIAQHAFLSVDAIRAAATSLEQVGPATIAEAVSIPPDSWGVGLEGRVALASYLALRRRQLLDVIRGSR